MPLHLLSLNNNFDYLPQISVGFKVKPNYEIVKNKTLVNEQVENFMLGRSQVNSGMDLKIVDGSPIIKTVKYMGRVPFEVGYQ